MKTLLIICTCLVFTSLAYAGDNVYDNLYDGQRFDKIDTNSDGYLDKDELNTEQRPFEKPYEHQRFRHADRDKDGKLNLNETRQQKKFEKKVWKRR